MRNIWELIKDDIRCMRCNVVTGLIPVGLVLLPSIFSWYNVLACWDVFGNTGNMKVAVANVDEGYESDLIPIEINVGDRIVSALHENDQLAWVFTSKDDAIEGVRAGRYYAAVVIPESFSSDMMSFYSKDVEHASIVYYANDKKSAIAPKVTDQGADQIANQVNEVFAETISEAALGISSGLIKYAQDDGVSGNIVLLAQHVDRLSKQLADSASIVRMYAKAIGSSSELLNGSTDLADRVNTSATEVSDTAQVASQTISGSMEVATSSLKDLADAVEDSVGRYDSALSAMEDAFSSVSTLSSDASSGLRNLASRIRSEAQERAKDLEKFKELSKEIDKSSAESFKTLTSRYEAAIDAHSSLADSLDKSAQILDDAQAQDDEKRKEVGNEISVVRENIKQMRTDFEMNLKPSLEDLSGSFRRAEDSLAQSGAEVNAISSGVAGSSTEAIMDMREMQGKVDAVADDLDAASRKLSDLSSQITSASELKDSSKLQDILSVTPSQLAEALSAPVELERNAVYSVSNFGSAMSPLYTTLALWIGALVMMVTLKPEPRPETMEKLENLKPYQVFCGKYCMIALIAFLQSTTVALGNMLFLGVQVENPLHYMVCFWVSGLVFSFIIYTLVAAMGNLGKAISVFLLIVQVSGGGGSFPLQLLPQFFQNVSPYLPITHAVKAMRAAMFGIYMNDFWVEILLLMAFIVPLAIVGLALKTPISKFVHKFTEAAESTKVL